MITLTSELERRASIWAVEMEKTDPVAAYDVAEREAWAGVPECSREPQHVEEPKPSYQGPTAEQFKGN